MRRSADLQLSFWPLVDGAAPILPATADVPKRIPAEGVEVVMEVRGTPLPVRIRRSRRARQLRLLVERDARFWVVLPMRYPLREVPAALEEHGAWILRTVERHRRRPLSSPPALRDGSEIGFLGETLVVRIDSNADRESADESRVWRDDGRLRIARAPLDARPLSEIARPWLRAEASSRIPERVAELARELGFCVGRVTVRDQKTKWGACSPKGHLSFNWRLALAPSGVLDYVIVHELCHLRELNHSARFWRLVGELRPWYETERRWLHERAESLDL